MEHVRGQLALEVSGADRIHSNTGGSPLASELPGEPHESMLRCHIACLVVGRGGDDAVNRRDVDDAPATPLDHVGGNHPREHEGRHHVHLRDRPDGTGILEFRGNRSVRSSGIVDEDVDPLVVIATSTHQGRAILVVGDITLDWDQAIHIIREVLEAVQPPRCRVDGCTGRGENARKSLTQTRRCAGDNCHSSIEAKSGDCIYGGHARAAYDRGAGSARKCFVSTEALARCITPA